MSRTQDRHKNSAARRKYQKEYQWAYALMRDYGMSLQQYKDILAAQGNRCPICKSPYEPRRKGSGQSPHFPVVDHDHKHGFVRSVICNRCNVGLGCFSDSAEIVALALHHLRTARTEISVPLSAETEDLLQQLMKYS